MGIAATCRQEENHQLASRKFSLHDSHVSHSFHKGMLVSQVPRKVINEEIQLELVRLSWEVSGRHHYPFAANYLHVVRAIASTQMQSIPAFKHSSHLCLFWHVRLLALVSSHLLNILADFPHPF